MASNNSLNFSLIMRANTNDFVRNTQRSEAEVARLVESLKRASQAGNETSQSAQNTGKYFLNSAGAVVTATGKYVSASVAARELGVSVSELKNILPQFQRNTNSLGQEIQRTERATQSFDNRLNTLSHDLQGVSSGSHNASQSVGFLSGTFGELGHVLAGLGIGLTTAELAKTVDEYKGLSARLQLAIGEHGDLAKTMSDVSAVAMRTNSNLSATADLYSKISKAAGEMSKKQTSLFQYAGLEAKQITIQQKDILSLTESINKATQITGASAEATSASLYQLGQSLSSNVLRGEEYNSVLEGTPRIIQAVADGLGVGIGQLKAMADAGQLTTDVWLPAFLSQTSKLNDEFAKFPTTIGGAIENVKTAWTLYIGEVDKAYGVSTKVTNAILYVAEHLDDLSAVLKSTLEAFVAYKAIGLAKFLAEKSASFNTAAQAIRNNTTQIAANTQAEIANGQATQENTRTENTQIQTELQRVKALRASNLALADSAKQQSLSAQAKFRDIQVTRDQINAELALAQQKMRTQLSDAQREQTAIRLVELNLRSINTTRQLTLAENELTAARNQASLAANNFIRSDRDLVNLNQTLANSAPALSGLRSLGNGLMAGVSKLGMYGAAITGVVASASLIKETGEWIGETTAKLVLHAQGLKTIAESEKELAKQEEESKKKAEQLQEARKREAASNELAKRAALGLNDATKAVTDSFDQAVKSGTSVQNALKSVAESFSFDSTTGINNGITALRALEKQGKATAEQIKKALADALQGKDLVVFETNASMVASKLKTEMDKAYAELEQKRKEYDAWHDKATLQEINADAGKHKQIVANAHAAYITLMNQHNNAVQNMADVQDSTLKEAIRRTGLSYEELSGKATESFRIASNNIDIVVNNLEKLRSQGVDVGKAIGITIQNTIKEATNQDELEGIKARVESLRGVLGDKIADGLLDQLIEKGKQVKKTFDDIVPGINSVEEAARKLGIKTKAELKDLADDSLKNFKEVANSGKFTQEQLKEAAERMMSDAKKSGDQVAISAANAAASMGGLITKTDEAGNTIVKTSREYMDSLSLVGKAGKTASMGFDELGDSAEENAERSAKAWEKAGDRIANSQQKGGGGVGGNSTDEQFNKTGEGGGWQGGTFNMWTNQAVIESRLKEMGYNDKDAAVRAKKIYDSSHGLIGAKAASHAYQKRKGLGGAGVGFQLDGGYSNQGYVNEQLEIMKNNLSVYKTNEENRAKLAEAQKVTNQPTETHKHIFELANKRVEVQVPSHQSNDLNDMLKQLEMYKRSSM